MINRLLRRLLFGLVCISGALPAPPVSAVPMINDPKGFQDIEWGAALAGRPDVVPSRTGPHITEYRSTTGPAIFAGAEMTSILLLSVDDQ